MKVPAFLLTLLPLLASTFAAPAAAQTAPLTEVVCMDTNLGEFCLRLFPEDAPQTVANFLGYVNSGAYDNTVIHRSVANFIVQGGGYSFNATSGQMQEVTKGATVINEFKRSNTRGTIAMAKLGNDPNSATNEWFININNNTSLDTNNGGFTVFGEVVENGMNVVDSMQFFEPWDIRPSLGSAFGEVPLISAASPLTADSFVTIKRAYVTQRDLSILGRYSGNSFAVPVRVPGHIYLITFRQKSVPPVYVFEAETFSIVEHKDVGQQTAVFSNNTLSIPSLRGPGTGVFTDLVLRMTNHRTLEFTLESYNQQQ